MLYSLYEFQREWKFKPERPTKIKMVCLKFLPWAGSRSKLAFFAYQRYMRPKGCLCGFMLGNSNWSDLYFTGYKQRHKKSWKNQKSLLIKLDFTRFKFYRFRSVTSWFCSLFSPLILAYVFMKQIIFVSGFCIKFALISFFWSKLREREKSCLGKSLYVYNWITSTHRNKWKIYERNQMTYFSFFEIELVITV